MRRHAIKSMELRKKRIGRGRNKGKRKTKRKERVRAKRKIVETR